ncbi:DNA topoisomerase IV [Robiginitalea myxolifaciens]|uniref:DNA topoisomerase IV n=1 Tax=Robiginitalea myxolifaciens TaxID=400055 RepID=UPI000B830D72|nr:DNA topoisomerase IV [Robiginitalea myxolifaciens]
MKFALLFIPLLFTSCYQPERDCSKFKEGTFQFSVEENGETLTTEFTRYGELEVSEFNGQTDSARIRWINDCEYVLTSLTDTTIGGDKPIHMKILSTTEDSYTFEYKFVGTQNISRGTAVKID